jgi:hypothetical protein
MWQMMDLPAKASISSGDAYCFQASMHRIWQGSIHSEDILFYNATLVGSLALWHS